MICRKSDEDSIRKTVSFLKEGKVVIIPTDTVYGFSTILGEAGDKIRMLKGRSESKPFIQLISSPKDLSLVSDDMVPESLLSFWPGPLTIIVNSKQGGTVAVRCPGDKWIREVIAQVGMPIYSTSVNKSGESVICKENEILDVFGQQTDLVVLDGDKTGSIPSTIVNLTDGKVRIVREGALKIKDLF